MIRLFVTNKLKTQNPIPLDEKAQHYLCHVMRLHSNDELLCFNGEDGEWLAHLDIQDKKHAHLCPEKQIRPQDNPEFLALCPALIKKDNFDLVLQKATELGVTDIYPLLTEHTAHPHFNQSHAELIVREAAEQSERLTVPRIHVPLKLNQLQKTLPKECTICHLAERIQQANVIPDSGKIAFVVGPEGGWSEDETIFLQKNFIGIHFDIGILRAETASLAILSCWQLGRSLNWKK